MKWGLPSRWLAITESTNDVARDWALAGSPEGAVVIAARQTRGRGRRAGHPRRLQLGVARRGGRQAGDGDADGGAVAAFPVERGGDACAFGIGRQPLGRPVRPIGQRRRQRGQRGRGQRVHIRPVSLRQFAGKRSGNGNRLGHEGIDL